MADVKDPCLGCRKQVKNSKALQCIMCELWCHKDCGNISEDMFKLCELQKKEEGSAFWICHCCRAFATKMSVQMKEIDKRVTKLEKNCNAQQEAIQTVVKDTKLLGEKVEAISKEQKQMKTQGTNNESKNISEVLRELREQEARKNNVVVHNMEESDEANSDSRKEHDMENLKNLAGQLGVSFSRDKVQFMKRLGKKTDGKIRPLLIGMKETESKEQFLDKARTLVDKDEPWCDVFLCPDLTPKQREEDENARKECEKKNAERTEEEALNYEYRVVGKKGQRRIVISAIRDTTRPRRTASQPITQRKGGRGGQRGRGGRGGR